MLRTGPLDREPDGLVGQFSTLTILIRLGGMLAEPFEVTLIVVFMAPGATLIVNCMIIVLPSNN
jgi:hypothetical protein